MTEEELRSKLFFMVRRAIYRWQDNEPTDIISNQVADQILILVKEAGYISPAELKPIIDKASEIIGTEESLRSIACIEVALDWLQRRVEERKDWKSPHEVQSAVFKAILFADDEVKKKVKKKVKEG